MSLTSDMKDELARTSVATQSEMAAEVCSVLRFAGGLHLVGGRILIEAELDSPVAARRLRAFLQALYNASPAARCGAASATSCASSTAPTTSRA